MLFLYVEYFKIFKVDENLSSRRTSLLDFFPEVDYAIQIAKSIPYFLGFVIAALA